MDPIARFQEYAAAFEDVVKNDDWTILEPFFTEDAVYEVKGAPPFAARHAGRSEAFAGLKASLDALDRRFASRQVELLEGPALRDGAVWFRWRLSYHTPGLPQLVVDGFETVHFEGDRIRLLVDDLPLEMAPITEYWFAQYGRGLGQPGA